MIVQRWWKKTWIATLYLISSSLLKGAMWFSVCAITWSLSSVSQSHETSYRNLNTLSSSPIAPSRPLSFLPPFSPISTVSDAFPLSVSFHFLCSFRFFILFHSHHRRALNGHRYLEFFSASASGDGRLIHESDAQSTSPRGRDLLSSSVQSWTKTRERVKNSKKKMERINWGERAEIFDKSIWWRSII